MDIDRKLKEIIIEVAYRGVQVSEINDATVLTTDLGFDSVQIISLIVESEAQFKIEIEDDDLDIEKLTIYKNLYAMVFHKVDSQRN